MKAKLLLLLILCGSAVHAKDLGVHGMVYPIEEDNLVDVIKAHANQIGQQGAFDRANETLMNDVMQKLNTTDTLVNLKKTEKERIYTVSLSDTAPALAQNVNGTHFNNLTITLLFIDGTDESQLEWAINQPGANKKIILISGDVMALMKTYDLRFYADQEGALIKRLGIQQVPAKVDGDKHELKVHEVKL